MIKSSVTPLIVYLPATTTVLIAGLDFVENFGFCNTHSFILSAIFELFAESHSIWMFLAVLLGSPEGGVFLR